ncbi:conserved protein of unknown function [Methylorubrum extorquens]|uniref:DUF4325 domain-containing protein n=1 Tax=Methylorubrum extorquens TaxID=408 RepID=A0A2N9ASM9_METEX|nr:conserved protein of unknown function [Methylorubrum extorquens]
MVINLIDILPGAYTGEQGQVVYDMLSGHLKGGRNVTISFAGIDIATSAFVNAAFVPLLQIMALEEIKTNLKIVNSTKQINDMIKMRLTREAAREAA